MLNIVKLETLNQKIIARRKPGRPRTTSSTHSFLKNTKDDPNREKLLENYLNEGRGKNYCQLFAHQVTREPDGVEHLAVVRAFRKDNDNDNDVSGATVH